MRIVDIREITVPISRYADPTIPSGGLSTSVVAVVTDVNRNGKPIVGFGFSSIGRFAQAGLIRERFAPRLLAAHEDELAMASGDNIDPFRAWSCMMKAEKPGGHGERCVAVGTLDMAIWDAAAKIADQPLYTFIAELIEKPAADQPVSVYAGGGYYYPDHDIDSLKDEIKGLLDLGYTHLKIKIGGVSISEDRKRIEAVLSLLPSADRLAVDAMNGYSTKSALDAAEHLATYQLRWFEDICDPLDFEAQTQIAEMYAPSIGAGEALFSLADARNLLRYGGLRADRDVLLFDPAHCYGIPEYLRIVEMFEKQGWQRRSFWPHGGHLFSLHVAAALNLAGSESNPLIFQPFGGFSDGAIVGEGKVSLPNVPGIGFETRASLSSLFNSLL